MEIKALDSTLLCINSETAKILVNPTQAAVNEYKPDIIVTTNDKEEVKEIDKVKLFDWPGEYEAKGVLVHAIAHQKNDEEVRSLSMEIDGVRVCIVAELDNVPDKKKIAEFGNVDVLILSTELKASDLMVLVEEVDPYELILLNKYNSGDKEWTNLQDFLKESGEEDIQPVNKIELKSRESIDTGGMTYTLLNC